jgi:hypothetical protein
MNNNSLSSDFIEHPVSRQQNHDKIDIEHLLTTLHSTKAHVVWHYRSWNIGANSQTRSSGYSVLTTPCERFSTLVKFDI